MKQLLKSSILALSVVAAGASHAHEDGGSEHPMSVIAGTGVDLKTRDHAFAGAIGDWLAMGDFKHDGFVSNIKLMHGPHVVTAEFTQKDGEIGGNLSHVENGVLRETRVRFLQARKTAPQFVFEFNGKSVDVFVEADDFDGHHFSNPTYTAIIGEKERSFTLKGAACYGYSAHLIMMIFGTLAHIQE